jgi:hypothetical protein
MTLSKDDEKTLLLLMETNTLGAVLLINKGVIEEYSQFCAPEMKEVCKDTADQLNKFISELRKATLVKFRTFSEKLS